MCQHSNIYVLRSHQEKSWTQLHAMSNWSWQRKLYGFRCRINNKVPPPWWKALAVEVAKQFPDAGRYNLNAVYVFSDWDWPIGIQLLWSMALNVCSSLLTMVYCYQMFTCLSSPLWNCTDLYANRDSYRRWGLSKPAAGSARSLQIQRCCRGAPAAVSAVQHLLLPIGLASFLWTSSST